MRHLPLAAVLLGLAAGCVDVTVTPRAIREIAAPDVPTADRDAAIALWEEAVALANEFLASDWRRTLPDGRYLLDPDAGMRFVAGERAWPIVVRCTTWGDLCVACGFAAQERADGFVVGRCAPDRDRRIDHSLFRFADGTPLAAIDVAGLILHETTHTVWREGTVGFWNGVAYYLEAIFLLRAEHHSDERRPHATDHEFGWFAAARHVLDPTACAALRAHAAAHLALEDADCEHGPFAAPPP